MKASNLFCVVDVGEGKEAADGKIRGMRPLLEAPSLPLKPCRRCPPAVCRNASGRARFYWWHP